MIKPKIVARFDRADQQDIRTARLLNFATRAINGNSLEPKERRLLMAELALNIADDRRLDGVNDADLARLYAQDIGRVDLLPVDPEVAARAKMIAKRFGR